MIAGITEKEQKIIEHILDKYRKDYAFFYYGSRVKGTYEKTSDLDVLIKGKAEMPLAILQEIKEEFDKSDLPYIVNFSDYYKLDSSFYERIKPDLIPYNWQEVKLGNFLIINPTEKLSKGTIAKKVSMEKLQPFSRDVSGYELDEFSGGAKFRNKDTIMARITPCLENGKRAQINILKQGEVGFGSTEFIVFREKGNISDANFIYYLVCSDLIRSPAIKSMVGSSGRQRVQTNVLENLHLFLPPLTIQKKIAGVLGALDDKIELNNKINQNLEAQAQALFLSYSQYFNTKKTLFDIATIRYGKGLPTSKLQKNGYEVFGGNGVIGFYSSYLYEEPQILISCRGAASGTILESHPYSYVTNNSLIIELKDRKYYQFLKQYFLLNQLCSYATGSAQPQITIDNLKMVEVPYPNYESISTLDKCLETISNNAYNNIQENTQLAELRDTLLPKLMSGEINVDDVKID